MRICEFEFLDCVKISVDWISNPNKSTKLSETLNLVSNLVVMIINKEVTQMGICGEYGHQDNDIVCEKCGQTYQESENSFSRDVPKGSGECEKYLKCPFCYEEYCLKYDQPSLGLHPY